MAEYYQEYNEYYGDYQEHSYDDKEFLDSIDNEDLNKEEGIYYG